MQYQVNPTYQTQENGFLRILTDVNTGNDAENIFFRHFLLVQQLPTIEMSINMQNQQNLMIFSRENGQKPHFGPNLGQFWARTIFFQKSENVSFLDLLKTNLMQKIRKI